MQSTSTWTQLVTIPHSCWHGRSKGLSASPISPNISALQSENLDKKKTKTIVKRAFQLGWFNSWPWIHHNESDDTVLCHTCVQATEQNTCSGDPAFVPKGFNNWKDSFRKHESSAFHKETIQKLITLPATWVEGSTEVCECGYPWIACCLRVKYWSCATCAHAHSFITPQGTKALPRKKYV